MKIYKHTSPSGKSYIGKTSKSVQKRLNEHIKLSEKGSTYKFHKAIRKYGIENIESSILEDNICSEKVNEREKYWIAYYDTYKNGYNMTEGGDGGDTISNHPNREKICKKISEANSGERNGFYGKKHSEENKQKWSEQMKGNSLAKGYKHTEEAKNKIAEKNTLRFLDKKERVKVSLGVKKYAKNNPEELKKRYENRKLNGNDSNHTKILIIEKLNGEKIELYGQKSLKEYCKYHNMSFRKMKRSIGKGLIEINEDDKRTSEESRRCKNLKIYKKT